MSLVSFSLSEHPSCSDEEVTLLSEEDLFPGICPYCKSIYKEPVTLACGHSLCRRCCQSLLSSSRKTSSRCVSIRMGVSSLQRRKRETEWLSPRCVVCGERPKKSPPVPNRDLDAFLTNLCQSKELRNVKALDNHPIRIFDCNVAVVGARGVGKTTLMQTQFSNEMMVSSLLGRRWEEGCTPYMLNILDSQSLDDKMSLAVGFVIVYSITDRSSFFDTTSLFQLLRTTRGERVPIILIGTKSDLSKRREVLTSEGYQLARFFDCPFREVSSFMNESVNETFVELVKMIDSRGVMSISDDSESISSE